MCVDTDMGLGMGKLCNIIDMQGLGFTCDRYVSFFFLAFAKKPIRMS